MSGMHFSRLTLYLRIMAHRGIVIEIDTELNSWCGLPRPRPVLDFIPTFSRERVFGSNSRETAVKAEVTLAIKIAMTMRPNIIQMMEKMRATIDFGDLSPYLVH